MGFLVLLKFSVKCFDILAWPLFALGYPLCASIRAIESNSNSDIRKLVNYWVIFTLISLFDHAFARLLEWLSFWPYTKLMAIFLLVVPHFDGSFYVYENLVRPCFSVNPRVFFERRNNRKEFFLNREKFLVAAELYVKENGPEALERLIASKCTKPNVDVEEIKPVAATEKKEGDRVKCKEPTVARKDTKAVEVIEKKVVAVEPKCKEPNVAQKETKAVEVIEKKEVAAEKLVNQTVPNIAQTEGRSFATAETSVTWTQLIIPEHLCQHDTTQVRVWDTPPDTAAVLPCPIERRRRRRRRKALTFSQDSPSWEQLARGESAPYGWE